MSILPMSRAPALTSIAPQESQLGSLPEDIITDGIIKFHLFPLSTPEDIGSLSLTNKRFSNLTKSPMLWQILCERDFGYLSITGKYRNAYIEKTNSLRQFIKTLPNNHLLLSHSLSILSSRSFPWSQNYINTLSPKQLSDVFFQGFKSRFFASYKCYNSRPKIWANKC